MALLRGNPKERWEKYGKNMGKYGKYGENIGKIQEKREEVFGENMRNLREKYRKLWVNMVNSWGK